jgi:hypothetical protein
MNEPCTKPVRDQADQSSRPRRIAAGALWVVGWLYWAGFSQAATVNWAGRTWAIKEGLANPGQNHWSATTNCVWVDTNGYLHLKVSYFSNHWYCAEIASTNNYPYGDYRFQVESAVTNLDTNIVVGFFLYSNVSFLETLGPPEIDIEFARQFKDMSAHDNSSYAIQPALTPPPEEALIPTNSYYFRTTNLLNNLTTHRFVWTNDRVNFESYTGHGAPGSGSLIARWTRMSNSVSQVPQEYMGLRLHLNCYLFQHKEPSAPQNTEVILRGLITPEPIPTRPTATNLLDGFEEGILSLPPTPFTLYDFEQGIRGWGVEWNYNYGFLTNSGDPVHGGTNCMRIYNSWAGDVFYKHHITNGVLRTNNWTTFNKITYWARSATTIPTNKIKMVFFESSGQYWYENIYHPLTTNWQQFEIPLNSSSLGTDTIGDPLNLANITKFKFETLHYASGGGDGSIYFDDVQLVTGGVTNYTWKLGSWNASYAQLRLQTNVAHTGTNAAEIAQQDITTTTWDCLWTTNLLYRNWTNYNKIAYWARRSTSLSDPLNSNHLVKVQFIQQDGDIWEQRGYPENITPTNIVTTNWLRYEAALNANGFSHGASDWTNPPGNPPGHPPYPPGDYDISTSMTNIYAVRFIFFNPWTNQVSYYVDDVSLLYEMGPPSVFISISNRSVGFAPLAPSPANSRFASTNYASVYYQVDNSTLWQIVLYTAHTNRRQGLLGESSTNDALPLRAWAGTNAPPNPGEWSNWTGLWSYVNDQYGTVWPIANSLNPPPSGFRLYFATDGMGAPIQTYSASVIVELMAQ